MKNKKTPTVKQIESYYRDQAPYSSKVEDRHISATFTPHGIRQIDSLFIRKIQNLPTRKYADQVKKEIIENPHLHEKIKENLLLNLKNMREEIGPESKARYDRMEAATAYEGRRVMIRWGPNAGIVGTVVWRDEGSIGCPRMAVESNNPYFLGSLMHDLTSKRLGREEKPRNYFSKEDLIVISEEDFELYEMLDLELSNLMKAAEAEERQHKWEAANPQLEFEFLKKG